MQSLAPHPSSESLQSIVNRSTAPPKKRWEPRQAREPLDTPTGMGESLARERITGLAFSVTYYFSCGDRTLHIEVLEFSSEAVWQDVTSREKEAALGRSCRGGWVAQLQGVVIVMSVCHTQ